VDFSSFLTPNLSFSLNVYAPKLNRSEIFSLLQHPQLDLVLWCSNIFRENYPLYWLILSVSHKLECLWLNFDNPTCYCKRSYCLLTDHRDVNKVHSRMDSDRVWIIENSANGIRTDVRYLEEKNERKYVRFFRHTSCYMDYRN